MGAETERQKLRDGTKKQVDTGTEMKRGQRIRQIKGQGSGR